MHTAICLASGPSLTQADVDYCRGKGRVYAVKECHHMAPWADVLYAADWDWWDKFKGVPEFQGEKYAIDKAICDKYGLNYVPYKDGCVWSTDPAYIATGGNSGFQAVNLAVLQGAARVILLGYDFGHQPGQPKHWWDAQHPRESRWSHYAEWIKRFEAAAPLIPVPVLNASRESALTCFPRVKLGEVL